LANANWKLSNINLDLYLSKEDLTLLRDKRGRKDKNKKNNIVTRSLELVLKAKKGDVEARNTLFLLHTPLMRNILNKKFFVHPSEFDDYISECFFWFLTAVEDFDKKKSNNFVSLLQTRIQQRFINKYKYDDLHDLDCIEYIESDKDYELEKSLIYEDENLFNIENK